MKLHNYFRKIQQCSSCKNIGVSYAYIVGRFSGACIYSILHKDANLVLVKAAVVGCKVKCNNQAQ